MLLGKKNATVGGLALTAAVTLAAILVAFFGIGMRGEVAQAAAGGPVVLAGIDAEDGGPGGHGPITNYQQLVNATLSKATNGGTGILVIGGGDGDLDNFSVNPFWDAVDQGVTTDSVTYVSGASNITSQSFSGYKAIAVVSDESSTFGGLTQAEHDALSAKVSDVANFVNGGGGLIGFSSVFANPYAYIGGLGNLAVSNADYDNIAPTTEGTAVGITDDLDVCCWHQVFESYPNFLQVLANEPVSGKAAAVGGAQVIADPDPEPSCDFGEILPPVNDVSSANPQAPEVMSQYKYGARGSVPAKFRVSCDDDPIDTQEEADAHPMKLTLTKLKETPLDSDVVVETPDTQTGSSNSDGLFRFSGAPDNFYIYNISLRKQDGSALPQGTYRITISEDNGGGSHSEWFQIKKK